MNITQYRHPHHTGMLSFAKDLPNICSLAGLLCAMLGVYFAILKNFPAYAISMIWAVLFDWFDGIIARKMKNRTEEQKAFGSQLDSLIDMVSFGICPGVFLLSYGNFSPLFLPGAFVIIAASAIRLSYFNIFGLVDDSTYMGLALDNNIIIFCFIFLFENFFAPKAFMAFIYVTFMVMACLNLAPVKTPKFAGRWVYALVAYTIVLTIIYSAILWKSTN